MKNKKIDLIFVHPPANVRSQDITLDADTGYTDQFVSIPTGFFSMADNLDKASYSIKILNLGERLFNSKDRNIENLVEDFLEEYNPKIVGIDLHWMIHSVGAIETAKLIKKYSPKTKVVLGGLTASLFAEEILEKYEDIDYVMVGECDEAIVDLVRELSGDKVNLNKVPNLAYRKNGRIIRNEIEVPDISSKLELTRYDLLVDEPIVDPDRALITIFRGCKKNCCYCTGAKKSFGEVMKRKKPCIIEPEVVVDLIKKNKDKGRDKIYLYGDIRHGGKKYVDRFFDELEKIGVNNLHIVFEFFSPATEDYIKRWRKFADINKVTLEATYSPESGNQEVRRNLGKGYSNEVILKHCKLVARYGIPQSTYFMLGLPGQTKETVDETLKLADKIVGIYAKKFKKDDLNHEVLAYCFMQIPDAGSRLFQNPEQFGFKFDFKGFEGLVGKLSNARHWSEAIGYSTNNFSREELVSTYNHIKESILKIYKKHGLTN